MRGIEGDFFVQGSSRKQMAWLLFVAGGRLSVVDSAGHALARPESLDTVVISSRIGNTPRFVRFAGGGLFETAHNDEIDRLLAENRPSSGLAHKLESRLRYVAFGLLLTVFFVWAGIQYGIPVLAQYAAFSLSAENNRRLGQGMLEVLDKTSFAPSALPLAEQKRLRGRFLAFLSSADGIPVQIEFRDASKSFGANALALPSGTVVFTDQLVRLAQNDQELMAVYAHEVGHVARRHAMRRLLQSSAMAVLLVSVTGDVSSVSSLFAAAPALLVQSGYARNFEREADQYAVQQMQQGGLDVLYLARFLQRMEEARRCGDQNQRSNKEGKREAKPRQCAERNTADWSGYFSTHPPTEERARMIEQAPL